MSDIPPIQGTSSTVYSLPSRPAAAPAAAGAAAVDHLELSDVAQILAKLPVNTSIRAEKVARIREAIQEGTYETPDKLERVLDRLMDVLKLR